MQATIYTIDGKEHSATLTLNKINEIVSLIHLTTHRSLEIELSDSEILVLDSANIVGIKCPKPAQTQPAQAEPQAPTLTEPLVDPQGPISDI